MPAPGCAVPNDDFLGRIDPVNLKHVLGDIQTDRGNLHLDGSPHVIRLRRSLYGTSTPGAGAVHHIKPGPRALSAILPLSHRLRNSTGRRAMSQSRQERTSPAYLDGLTMLVADGARCRMPQ